MANSTGMKPVPKNQKHPLSEKGFRSIIENAHEGIVVYDLSGRVKFASKSVKKVCGYTERDLMGKKGTAFLHPDDADIARDAFLKLLGKRGKSITLFQRIRHKKGHYLWAESLLTNFSHDPEIKGVVSNFRDISEKKAAEEKALESQDLLETINRNLTEGIYMGIVGTTFLHVNEAFLKIFGFKSLRELQKIKPSTVYADQNARKRIVKTLKQQHMLKDVETLFRKKNGEKFWGILNASLLKHEGKENYFVGTIRDITKEKEAAAALVSSENFLNNIVSTAAAPIFVKDSKHRWIMFNTRLSELVGRTREELLGKTDKDLLLPKEARVFLKVDNEVLRTGRTISKLEKITSQNGDVHELLTVKSRYINEKKEKYIIGFITDITQLKQAEEQISQLNANLRGILESTKESIYAVDKEFNYLAFNQNHKRVMKVLYNADIEIGGNKLDYLRRAKDFSWVKAEVQKALNGRNFISEHHLNYPGFKGFIQTTYNPIRNSNNEIRGAAVFITDITPRKKFEEIIKSINANLRGLMESTTDHVLAVDRNLRYITFNQAHAQGFHKLFNANIRFGDSFLQALTPALKEVAREQIGKALNGKQFVIEEQLVMDTIFEVSLNPIRNEKKVVTGVAIFARDITQRKKIEEKMKVLNDELVRHNIQLASQEDDLKEALEELSERNFELDQLMYKTSHDLRSPLSSILGLVNLATLDDDPSNIRQYLTKIDDRIKKLDEFIKSMLNYARVNRADVVPEKMNLEETAHSCLHELEYLENFKAVKTTIQCKQNGASFTGDPLRVNIIFSNIISNAYKYYNPETSSFLNIRINVTSKNASIEFKDNGIGIKQEHLDKIFNMFYRATDRSQGSGLGMYIVKQAVEKLAGQINIESEYGRGTHIRITLPNEKNH